MPLSMFKPKTFRSKVTIATVVGVAVLGAVSMVNDYTGIRDDKLDDLRERAEEVASLAASVVAVTPAARNVMAVQVSLAPLLSDPDFVGAWLFDDTGRQVAAVTPRRAAPAEDRILRLVRDVRPIAEVDPTVRPGRLEIAFSRERVAHEMREIALRLLLELGALVIILGVAQTLIVRALTKPLERLSQVIQRRSHGDYDDHIGDEYMRRGDEVGAVARALQLDLRRRRDEKKLLDATAAIATQLDLDKLLEKIMEAATNLLDADRSSLFLFDERRKALVSRVAQGLEEILIHMPVEKGVIGAVWSSGQPVLVTDTARDKRFDASSDLATGYRTESIVAVPLMTKGGRLMGVAEVLNKRQGKFDDRDVDLLCSLAAQAASAIENARLFEEVVATRNYNESILRSLSNGVISFDEHLAVAKTNQAAEQVIGLPNDKLGGRPVDEVFGGDNAWIGQAVRRVVADKGRDVTYDTSLVDAQGNRRSVNMTVEPLTDSRDRAIGALAVLEDITKEKRLRGTMARYLSKHAVDQLMEAGADALGGTTQRVSILFTDIRSFTDITERIGARHTVRMLNEYFGEMVDVIEQHEGVLDKFIGDAIMALYGVPFPEASDADRALATAGGMMDALQHLNVRRASRGERPLACGVGINTGEVVLGNIGSPKRMDYTVIGDGVNLAARLEAATKTYGVSILVSEFTLEQLADRHGLREVDAVRVKGKKKPVRIFESLRHCWDDTPDLAESVALTEAGLGHFRRQEWDAAERAFADARKLRANDRVAALYLGRIADYRASPPPEDWDGVYVMKTK